MTSLNEINLINKGSQISYNFRIDDKNFVSIKNSNTINLPPRLINILLSYDLSKILNIGLHVLVDTQNNFIVYKDTLSLSVINMPNIKIEVNVNRRYGTMSRQIVIHSFITDIELDIIEHVLNTGSIHKDFIIDKITELGKSMNVSVDKVSLTGDNVFEMTTNIVDTNIMIYNMLIKYGFIISSYTHSVIDLNTKCIHSSSQIPVSNVSIFTLHNYIKRLCLEKKCIEAVKSLYELDSEIIGKTYSFWKKSCDVEYETNIYIEKSDSDIIINLNSIRGGDTKIYLDPTTGNVSKFTNNSSALIGVLDNLVDINMSV